LRRIRFKPVGESGEMNGEKVPETREEWIKIIERSTRDLHDRVDGQLRLLLTILGRIQNQPSFDSCPTADCPHKRRFRRVLLETIGVLEETRTSFKSRRLAELRMRLTEILKETD